MENLMGSFPPEKFPKSVASRPTSCQLMTQPSQQVILLLVPEYKQKDITILEIKSMHKLAGIKNNHTYFIKENASLNKEKILKK